MAFRGGALGFARRLAAPRLAFSKNHHRLGVYHRRVSPGQSVCAPPPPRVTVAVGLLRPVTRHLEATGNTAAVNSADLVARVSGFIEEMNYQDGARVRESRR